MDVLKEAEVVKVNEFLIYIYDFFVLKIVGFTKTLSNVIKVVKISY